MTYFFLIIPILLSSGVMAQESFELKSGFELIIVHPSRMFDPTAVIEPGLDLLLKSTKAKKLWILQHPQDSKANWHFLNQQGQVLLSESGEFEKPVQEKQVVFAGGFFGRCLNGATAAVLDQWNEAEGSSSYRLIYSMNAIYMDDEDVWDSDTFRARIPRFREKVWNLEAGEYYYPYLHDKPRLLLSSFINIAASVKGGEALFLSRWIKNYFYALTTFRGVRISVLGKEIFREELRESGKSLEIYFIR